MPFPPVHPVLDAALAHYQFEAIPPFADGNGRIGRILITLMLHERGVLAQPLLYMSPFLERHKRRYIDLMFNVSQRGDWHSWTAFFLEAVVASSNTAISTVRRLQDLRERYRGTLQTPRRSALLLRLVDLAFERPVITVPDIASALGVTYAGAMNNVTVLVKAGVATLLRTGFPMVVVFREVIEAVQG